MEKRSTPLGAIVIPVDFARRATQLLSRTISLVSVLQDAPFEVVVAHNDRGGLHDKLLQLWVRQFGNHSLRLVSGKFTEHVGHQSLLRNRAMEQVMSEIALFLDVDIYPDKALFAHLMTEVQKGTRLAMAPCLYLTARGTQRLRSSGDVSAAMNDYLAFDRKCVLHMAMPSSVMSMKVVDYWQAGGFDERYYGHGYEDFDFMVRFAHWFALVKPCFDVFVDKTYRAPLLAEGFRATLSQLAIANLLDEHVALHLFHSNEMQGPYRERRKKNALLFQSVLIDLYDSARQLSTTGSRLELEARFERECKQRAVDPQQFKVLSDNRAGHVGRGFSLQRQVRKIEKWVRQ
ncbi:galactosyltransferase-related protein [Noviherbaspirillum sp. 1P10PC]|uniref:galactosyltransferase-related protein n=1 Tax=Noviherbaspirillum sp. 1P10PC TaxID=3132292 RepID=UPI0039A013B5